MASSFVAGLLSLLGIAEKLLQVGLLRTNRGHAEKGHHCGKWTRIS